ncbi:tetratricopeptide repeat protein [Acidocella sp.]|uniref:tetratricopeptide repeat protein n=1 Tax=Acidocella sp. TaxID=50710 RepID=UPI002617A374|nr:tetratricopeptide repeat protein [Acidocella sp.]
MKLFTLPALALGAALSLAAAAHAQTPRDIQSQIAAGQSAQAITELNSVLTAHPSSAVAWYLLAEAQDAQGNEQAAGSALAKAQSLNPAMSFANPQDVASLQAHINNSAPAAPYAPRHAGGHTGLLVVGGLILLFLALRAFGRRRAAYMGGYGPAPFQQPGYGPGPFYPQGGGGLGSSILGGLAAGAGFAAGERIIEDLTGGNQANAGQIFTNPGADDGLMGNPGWGDNSGGGLDDLNSNSWS